MFSSFQVILKCLSGVSYLEKIKRSRYQVAEPIKISLSDLSIIVHVSNKTNKTSVYKKRSRSRVWS